MLLLPCTEDGAGGVHDCTAAVGVKGRGHILGAAALRSVAGHQEEGMRQGRTQLTQLLRIRRADNRANARIAILTGEFFAPLLAKRTHRGIERLLIVQNTILQLSRGGV